MTFFSRFFGLMAIAVSLFATAGTANAAYTLSNSNGGDGYLMGSYPSFQLYGADNGVGTNTTLYTDTFSTATNITFSYVTNSYDCCGAEWDPAGYYLDGALVQLSPNDYVVGDSASGTLTVDLAAGDTFGWYVTSPDSCCGRGEITVDVATVPEPATFTLLGAGLLGLGAASRRKARMA